MIDRGIAASWPSEVIAATEAFALGDLIESPPFFYSGDEQHPVWNDPARTRSDTGVVELPPDSRPPYGIITSQTCDVVERGARREQPWVQVSPVYAIESEAAIRDRFFLYRLTTPKLPDLLVADLRLEFPLEKNVLVGRKPISGFASEGDTVRFAERLGRRRDRAALADAVNDVLYRRLSKRLSNNRERAKRVFENIHAVGLEIAEGTRLEPIAVGVHFITTGGQLDDDATEWFEAWWDAARQDAEQHRPSLSLQPNTFHDGGRMDLAIYDRLIPLGWRP